MPKVHFDFASEPPGAADPQELGELTEGKRAIICRKRALLSVVIMKPRRFKLP
jgi:hypothetical protein